MGDVKQEKQQREKIFFSFLAIGNRPLTLNKKIYESIPYFYSYRPCRRVFVGPGCFFF
jgi:hypothetical protein